MDVHVPRAVTKALRLRGVDVVTAQEDGSQELDDDVLLNRATELGRILVSQDDDLLREANRLLSECSKFSGVIYAHQLTVTVGQMIADLELIALVTSPDEWSGRVEFLPLK